MIKFQKVVKKFTPDSFGALDQSFKVNSGEMVFITGKSGSGKTTMMRLLTKEYTPTTGEIWFDGQNLSELKPGSFHKHRRKIGVVFQDYRLLPELTAKENIVLPFLILNLKKDEIEKRVADLLNLVKLENKADLFPSQLSGGEAQRVSIARALAMSPKVLFADEPTGNLDPETSIEIAELLEKINSLGTTVLFATHDQSLLEKFGSYRTLTLSDGKIIKDTQPATLKKEAKQKTKKLEKKSEEKATKKKVNLWHKLKSLGFPLAKKNKKKKADQDKRNNDNKKSQDSSKPQTEKNQKKLKESKLKK